MSVYEYPQTISAIINGKRNMNTPLAIRIEEKLGIESGFFMTLQIFFDIKQEKARQTKNDHPSLSRFRPALFWDTNIEHIDWRRQKRPIIKRVFERGTFTEKKEILSYYGRDLIKEVLNAEKRDNNGR